MPSELDVGTLGHLNDRTKGRGAVTVASAKADALRRRGDPLQSKLRLAASRQGLPSRRKSVTNNSRMIAAPEMRRFICTTAQSDRCATQVQQRISYVNSKPPPEEAPKRAPGTLFSRVVVSFGCLLLFEVQLPAQVWTGTSGVNWTTGANWAGGSPPTSTGTATFNAPTPSSPTINASVPAGQLAFHRNRHSKLQRRKYTDLERG